MVVAVSLEGELGAALGTLEAVCMVEGEVLERTYSVDLVDCPGTSLAQVLVQVHHAGRHTVERR